MTIQPVDPATAMNLQVLSRKIAIEQASSLCFALIAIANIAISRECTGMEATNRPFVFFTGLAGASTLLTIKRVYNLAVAYLRREGLLSNIYYDYTKVPVAALARVVPIATAVRIPERTHEIKLKGQI